MPVYRRPASDLHALLWPGARCEHPCVRGRSCGSHVGAAPDDTSVPRRPDRAADAAVAFARDHRAAAERGWHRALQGCPRVGSLGRCGASARHCGSVRSLRARRLRTPQAFRLTRPRAAIERRSLHCVALQLRERYDRNAAVCRPTGSGAVARIAALYARAMSSGFATRAGRSRRFGRNPKPDFSGDFHPASREIKQERKST